MIPDLSHTVLFDKIYAAMLAGAIGDAMGGPIEGWAYPRIVEAYGVVDTFLAYRASPDYHNQFKNTPGTVTDDTRLKHILCQAIIERGDLPQRGDFVRACVSAYQAATTDLERGFLEEYALGGLYGESKLIWGGQMTNGCIMMNAPLGLVCPCDPERAFALSYQVDFISDGYAKYSAAMAAAAVAAAMTPGANALSIVQAALDACQAHRIEGDLTRAWQWYDAVFQLNERMVNTAVEIAVQHHDVFSLRAAYYEALQVSLLGSEAAQTLAVALGMLVAANGDLRQTILGCVNYGRDNDSYAAVGGAIAGALQGIAAIPAIWRETIVSVNPELDIRSVSLALAHVAYRRQQRLRQVMKNTEALL